VGQCGVGDRQQPAQLLAALVCHRGHRGHRHTPACRGRHFWAGWSAPPHRCSQTPLS
jgi:hypothetical protein